MRNSTAVDWTDEMDKQLAALLSEGYGVRVIGEKMGIHFSSVTRRMQKKGFKKRPYHAGRMERLHRPSGRWERRVMPEEYHLFPIRRRNNWVLRSRYVMTLHLGRPLLPSETVHHINLDKTDDRLENLQLRQGQHGKGAIFECFDCGSRNVGGIPLEEERE